MTEMARASMKNRAWPWASTLIWATRRSFCLNSHLVLIRVRAGLAAPTPYDELPLMLPRMMPTVLLPEA